MLPGERLDVEVEVLVSGAWWPGFLEHRRPDGDQWEGFVRWSSGPGQNRVGWYDHTSIRQPIHRPVAGV